MARVKLFIPIKSISGKIDPRSKIFFAERYGLQYAGTMEERDYHLHPVTAREKETHSDMREACMAYNRLDKQSEEYKALVRAWEKQQSAGIRQNTPYKKTIRGYFISEYIKQANKIRDCEPGY